MDKTTELFCLIDDFCQQFELLLDRKRSTNYVLLFVS